jgi:hypothetical protein
VTRGQLADLFHQATEGGVDPSPAVPIEVRAAHQVLELGEVHVERV